MRPQIVEATEDDRFGRAHFCAGGHESALLSIVAKGAFEGAAGVGQRLRTAIDHSKRTGHDAITAAIANVVLYKHRANFGANYRAGGTRFEATGFFAVLANIGEKNPTEWVLYIFTA